ncbi:MAG: HDOD domain-containing protein [Colwellia sp.]|uniref:HDOD domain-containing protein n=1 Tax=Colwellia sp. TaxID=56799 RepID=UPI001D35B53A|nr:HDOD domain-containing protein [Colwellia sp.]NQY49270.1 HDOD domain-containing protein [Colwellia sp.]
MNLINKKSLLLTEAVNLLLNKSDVPATLTIEQCAAALAMSMTSFRRKLGQEETTFKLIQHKFLNELCVHALLTKNVSVSTLVLKLGYSERATFERAFRSKFGISPAQFRELSLVGNNKDNPQNLSTIAKNMPPLPDSCQQLLKEKDKDSFDLQRVIDIVANDAIFTGRLMGLASKAIYGKTPNNIQEAISRNLGINAVVNLAVIYSVKDALAVHVDQKVINQCTHAFVTAPKFFQLMRKSAGIDVKFDIALIEQVLVFALLGILLLCHKEAVKHQLILHSLQGIDDLPSLNHHTLEVMGISIYGASGLMLSLWHIDASVIKQLNHLDKVGKQETKASRQDELLLFMLSCLYALATGRKDHSELEQKAELLNLDGFAEVKAQLFSGTE